MNRKQEILVNYREITKSIDLMEREIERLSTMKYIGGPRPLRGIHLTGMPRGTNDPEAAMLQTVTIEDGLLDQIREKQTCQYEMMQEAYRIIDAIADLRLQNIVRSYYLHGMTDEAIAEAESMSQTHVNRLRVEYFNNLS